MALSVIEREKQLNQETLDQIVDDVTKKKHIYGAVFCVSSGEKSLDLISASGEMGPDSQYYIASINKLFISSIIMRLYKESRLDLEDKIYKYLSEETMQGLHIHKGKDYSKDLSIVHLMSHTSGLPCYLIDKQPNGKRVMTDLEAGIDQSWPIDKVIQQVKTMKTHFPPGKQGKAKYIDTNHQILSRIIENITGSPINLVLKKLFQELYMTRTFVCGDEDDEPFVPLHYKSKEIHLPLFLKSTQNDIVSTAKDQMAFLKAFFGGYFFPKKRLKELEKWNRIFFPFKYGIGLQKFYIPRLFSPFRPVPEMIGHCGSSGSVAFYIPDKDLYITGSTNQQAKPSVAFQTMIKIANRTRKPSFSNPS